MIRSCAPFIPLMRPGAWLIFHDTDLPAIATQLGVPQRYGAQWLFESWPGQKLSSDNIGAVALPQDLRTLRAFLEELSTRPFEVSESGWNRYRKMLADSFSYAFQ